MYRVRLICVEPILIFWAKSNFLSRYSANTDIANIPLADNRYRYADTDIVFADTDISVSVKISAKILAQPIIGLTLTAKDNIIVTYS